MLPEAQDALRFERLRELEVYARRAVARHAERSVDRFAPDGLDAVLRDPQAEDQAEAHDDFRFANESGTKREGPAQRENPQRAIDAETRQNPGQSAVPIRGTLLTGISLSAADQTVTTVGRTEPGTTLIIGLQKQLHCSDGLLPYLCYSIVPGDKRPLAPQFLPCMAARKAGTPLIRLSPAWLVRLWSVPSDLFGTSGQLMLEALLEGKADPKAIAGLAQERAKKKIPEIIRHWRSTA